MKQKLFIALSVTLISFVIIWACKEEELPEFSGINKVELTITADSTSYMFSEINCTLNQKSKFTVEQHGFCWDTLANVTIEKQKSNKGSLSNQSFEETIENILPNKTYYVKAYIQNQEAIIYSNELTINTLDARPVVTTNDITNILANSAQSGGNANAYETLFPITQRGVCWAKTQNPTIADSLTLNGTGNGTFVSNMQNLEIGETYFVRAYAINSAGIRFGDEKTFTAKDGLPTIQTKAVTEITTVSSVSGGNITNDGGFEIIYRGVCWSINSQPTTADNHTNNGSGSGEFISNITGLNGGTNYYVRAYAINSSGTGYGNEILFKTSPVLPTVTTIPVTGISPSTAVSGGEIVSDGGSTILSKGVCWGTNSNPTINDFKTTDGDGQDSYISNINGLNSLTTYYLRAYATNAVGTAYGNEIVFTTTAILPTVSTNDITNILTNSATSGGIVTEQGDANVTEKGICWSTNTQPTINDNFSIDGSGLGEFTSQMTNLYAGTQYHVRAYATSSSGTAYGAEKTFSTNIGVPTIITDSITKIKFSSAVSGGQVISDGGSSVTSFGICWSINPNPEITDNFTNDGAGLGGFESVIYDLNPGTNYYVRAYAINSFGTCYGNEILFSTIPLTISDLDGNTYNVIIIGDQPWTAENLKTTKYNDGTEIPIITDNSAWYYATSAGYCWYNNDFTSYANQGAIYNWYAVNTNKLCPSGWHVPTDNEWYILENFVDESINQPLATHWRGIDGGKKLKSTSGWNEAGNGTDDFGFNAIPAAGRGGNGEFLTQGITAFFWSSTNYSNSYAWYHGFAYWFNPLLIGLFYR